MVSIQRGKSLRLRKEKEVHIPKTPRAGLKNLFHKSQQPVIVAGSGTVKSVDLNWIPLA